MIDASQTSVLINIAKSLLPVQQLITGAAYVVGIAFALKALYSLKIYGEAKTMQSSSTSIKEPLFNMMIAGFLIFFPTGFELMMNTTFGYSNVLAYSDSSLTQSFFGGNSQLGHAVVIIFQTIGLYAFTRGWVLISRAAGQGQQPGGTGKGLMHIVGGILAVNIVGTVEVIKNTLFG
ncbi:MAG: type IV secretion protein IcmC [Legionella sp.]|jgi:intracellular multiplication protein IcmC|nr:type IV secretion protein IcmC [Legionella sp.]